MATTRFLLALFSAFGGLLLSLPIVMIILFLWLVSALTRTVAHYYEKSAVAWQQIIEFDSLLGWKSKPNLHVSCIAEPAGEIFKIITDSNGWRGHTNLHDSDIVVFGDSFAFGYGVDDADCFFNLRTEKPKIKSIGVPGYNMAQELLCMQRLAPQLRDKPVVWLVYVGNDIYDNLKPNHLHYRRPFVRHLRDTDQWEIYNAHVTLSRWPYHSGRQLIEHHEMLGNTYSSSFLGKRAYSACEYLIASAQDLLNRFGAELVVVTIPDIFELSSNGTQRLLLYSADPATFDPNLPHRRIESICSRLGVKYFSAKDSFQIDDYNPRDRHWTPSGHQRIKEFMIRLHADYTRNRQKPYEASGVNVGNSPRPSHLTSNA